jgi:hypothetical protein
MGRLSSWGACNVARVSGAHGAGTLFFVMEVSWVKYCLQGHAARAFAPEIPRSMICAPSEERLGWRDHENLHWIAIRWELFELE